jgi:hypothetical protein
MSKKSNKALVTYLKDYKIKEGKGFWLLDRKLVSYVFGVKIWTRLVPVTTMKAVTPKNSRFGERHYMAVPQEFRSRQACINFMNDEMMRLGSTKRYK